MPFIKLPGAHVPHRKNTASMPATCFIPSQILVPMSMHIGAPATPIVSVNDHVDVGQPIAAVGGFVSAPIHAGVSGTVIGIEDYLLSNGRICPAIRIRADGLQTPYANLKKPEITDIKSLIAAASDCGLVGLGGAGFPTSVKFSIGDKPLYAIVVNGAECEPYITTDTRTMLDRKDDLLYGLSLLQQYLKPKQCIIGIEKNKPECIRTLEDNVPAGVTIKPLPSVYPQGGEKVLVYHTTGHIVPEGKLPIDAGCIVINCTTLAVLGNFAKTGMPLVEKCITVDGGAVAHPQNIIVPVGTPMKEVFDACGGYIEQPYKLLYGGPMMGTAVPDDSAPILKNTNAILALTKKEATLPSPTACIRCGQCLTHCPFHLEPRNIKAAYERKDMPALQALHTNLCMECGCCSFVCPAHQLLTQTNKLAKGALTAWLKSKGEVKK